MQRIIATVGPALLGRLALHEVHDRRLIYRINGAHGTADDIAGMVAAIRAQVPDAAIMVDLPGNKVRTANLAAPIPLTDGGRITLTAQQVNYAGFCALLKPGDTIWANDSTQRFTVLRADAGSVEMRAHCGGELLNNKGLHVRGIHANLPFLFERDRVLIDLANRLKLAYVSLSFVRTAADIAEAQALIAPGITVIAKVETRAAVDNLDAILDAVEHVNVDRGDLSTEVGLTQVPVFQRYIIERARLKHRRVFLATQVLKNMEAKPVPTIAEINDLYHSIKSGVYGLQLSEETAVGRYPAEVLRMVWQVNDEIERETHGAPVAGATR
ncbi:MAG TPA: pyruvate kinase [bacterium]|nr:pyruvate kinase [bacterium]